MSVNVSAGQLRDPGFVGVVERTLAAMAGTGLVLEITERQGIADDTVVLETMRTIAALGVRFAIDDFGVGFSSFGYLRRVPAHVVKIDATLASEIDTDERACAVLAGIVTMAEALSLDVVVEGIERPAQLDKVRSQVRAPLVQGFLLHRPMPLAALLPVVRANRRDSPSARRRGGRHRPSRGSCSPRSPDRAARSGCAQCTTCGPSGISATVLYDGSSGPCSTGVSTEKPVCHHLLVSKVASLASTASSSGSVAPGLTLPSRTRGWKTRRSTNSPSRAATSGTPRATALSASMSPSRSTQIEGSSSASRRAAAA